MLITFQKTEKYHFHKKYYKSIKYYFSKNLHCKLKIMCSLLKNYEIELDHLVNFTDGYGFVILTC